MSEFLTPLKMMVLRSRTLTKRPLYQLTAPLVYYSDLLAREITVPAGAKTDLASIPYLPVLWLAFGDTAQYASVIHDHVYRSGGMVDGLNIYITKAEADEIFEEAMQVHVRIPGTDVDDPPVPWLPRKVMFSGVRVGGNYPVWEVS
ncbi:MAG TPA: DUF1353 domain-containing protein [Burkholderiales bacterium]